MRNIPQPSTQACLPELIGLPYSAFDCYELVRLFYRKVLGISLEQLYITVPEKAEDQKMVVDSYKPSFKEVDKPEFGDIILIRHMGLNCHVGVYLNEREFLHTQKGTGSIIDKSNKWKKRFNGFYKYAKSDS